MRQTVFMGTTKVDVDKTLMEITTVLRKAGATQISTDYVGGMVKSVRFGLNIAGIPMPVHFQLPCRTEKLVKLLRDKNQAERTGWRQVLRWVQAQLAMIDVGMTAAHEVFMPYAVIPGTDKTMFQAWESQQKLIEAPASRAQ